MTKSLGMAMLVLGVFSAVVGCDSREPAAGKRGAAGAMELTLDLGNNVTMKFVQIPAGNFVMGSPQTEKDHRSSEIQHEVTISKPFYIGVYEVTQAQWRAVMGTNPSVFKGENRPVEQVSWDNCQLFCKQLSAKAGRRIRLPTEAEWEYVCRAGTTTPYYFGDDVSQLAHYAWYDRNCGRYDWISGTSDVGTHDVGGKIPNAWGLYDMSGNVWEWCQDWYGPYLADSQADPTGPSNGSGRVLRGGSYYGFAYYCRAASRIYYPPNERISINGLRLVLDSE